MMWILHLLIAVCVTGTCYSQLQPSLLEALSGFSGTPGANTFGSGGVGSGLLGAPGLGGLAGSGSVGSGLLGAPGLGGLAGSGSAGGPLGSAGFCTDTEKQTAFNSCMYTFGLRHLLHFPTLQQSPTCRSELFNCREVNRLTQCLNSQPVSVISNTCWMIMDTVSTEALQRYNLPCTYQDLARQCPTAAPLVPIAQRRQTGRGTNNSLQSLLQFSIPIAIMMGGGGMFGL